MSDSFQWPHDLGYERLTPSLFWRHPMYVVQIYSSDIEYFLISLISCTDKEPISILKLRSFTSCELQVRLHCCFLVFFGILSTCILEVIKNVRCNFLLVNMCIHAHNSCNNLYVTDIPSIWHIVLNFIALCYEQYYFHSQYLTLKTQRLSDSLNPNIVDVRVETGGSCIWWVWSKHNHLSLWLWSNEIHSQSISVLNAVCVPHLTFCFTFLICIVCFWL